MGTVPPPSTPKAKVPTRVTADTPHVFKQTSIYCNEHYQLPVSRRAVANDLGQAIPQVDLAWFQANLLPPLPEGLDLNGLVAKLKHEKVIKKDRWAAYQRDPRQMKGHEDTIFARLKTLIEQIIESGSQQTTGSKQLLTYRSLPKVDMVTIYDKKRSKPDGYFVSPEMDLDHYYWYQVGVPGEYKPDETVTDCLDNRAKTVWNLYQQFREDPRRRFALAYSIENTKMRLWFANRSQVLVSTAFNFATNHEAFVGFVMRIAFAKEHQIGWDTTMELLPVPTDRETKITELMYDITVHAPNGPVVYRTKKLLSDVGARSIRGRGTRVWEAVKLDEDKKESEQHFALKDSWVDADRRREADILESVKKADDSDDYKETVKDYLLTVDSYGDVLIDVDPDHTRKLPDHDRNIPDHTRNLHANGQKIPAPATLGPIALVDTALHLEERLTTQGSSVKISEKAQERAAKKAVLGGSGNKVNFHEKQRHRVVFNEVGSSLYEETSLFEVFKSLALVAGVLAYIHRAGAGWVHRDISPGNILLFSGEEEATVKLADFEYAKEITDHTSHEVRTGTLDFMSGEADIRDYRFEALARAKTEGPLAKKTKLEDADVPSLVKTKLKTLQKLNKNPNKVSKPATSSPSAVFFHNALHDLESIWWIAVWFLIAKAVKSSTTTVEASFDTTKQRHLADRLFYNRGERLNFMNVGDEFQKSVRDLHPSVQNAAHILVSIKNEMLTNYEAAEEDPQSIGKDVANGLYTSMMDHLAEAAKVLSEEDVIVGNLPRQVAKTPVNASNVAAEAGPSATAGSRKRKSHE